MDFPSPVPLHILRILNFLGGRTRLQLSRSLLYTPKVRGGLGVPNIGHYYKAAQIAPIIQLQEGNLAPLWTLIDVLDGDPIPLSSIPWISPMYRPKSLNVILAPTLSVCDSIKYSALLISPHHPLLPLLN